MRICRCLRLHPRVPLKAIYVKAVCICCNRRPLAAYVPTNLDFDQFEIAQVVKEHFPRIQLTPAVTLWLETAYVQLRQGKHINPTEMLVELWSSLPDDFDYNTIDSRLIRFGVDLTLLGILHVDPATDLLEETDQVIRFIRDLVRKQPGIEALTSDQISEELTIPEEDVALIFGLIRHLGDFWNGGSGRGDKPGYYSVTIRDEKVKLEYLRYKGIDKLLEKLAGNVPNANHVGATTTTPTPNDNRHFDVCLSFAGEDREYVERVAAALRTAKVNLFYDRYEQVSLWGRDLYQHLDEVYRRRATYCVVFISRAYSQKLWTKHELRSAQARAFEENREYILPVRLDDTELPGVLPTIGYVSDKSPEVVARLIFEKIQLTDRLSPIKVSLGNENSDRSTEKILEEFRHHFVEEVNQDLNNSGEAVEQRGKDHSQLNVKLDEPSTRRMWGPKDFVNTDGLLYSVRAHMAFVFRSRKKLLIGGVIGGLLFFAGLGMAGPTLLQYERSQRFKSYVSDGEACHNWSNFDCAIDSFTKATALEPTDITVYSRRANAYYCKGEYKAAISDYNKVLEVYPFSYGFKIRGLAYLKTQNLTLAVQDLNKAIEMDSRDSETYFHRGLIYSATAQHKLAISDYDKTLSLKPDNWEALLYRGRAHFKIGDYTQAMDDFDRGLESALHLKKLVVSGFSELKPFRNHAEMQLVKDGYDEAIKYYSRQLDAKSDDVEAYHNRGRAYFYQAMEFSYSLTDGDFSRQDNYKKAIRDFNKALVFNPEFAKAYFSRSLALELLGETSDAQSDRLKYQELRR